MSIGCAKWRWYAPLADATVAGREAGSGLAFWRSRRMLPSHVDPAYDDSPCFQDGDRDRRVLEASMNEVTKQGPQHRIAVVEDDEDLREGILIPALRDAGFDAVGLPDALSFYRTLVGERFDLVMLDVGLPDERGTAIARHLRQLLPELGIVILSGYGWPLDKRRGLDAGADAYLVKPVEPSVIVDVIRDLLSLRSTPRYPAAGNSGWHLDDGGWRVIAPDGSAVQLTLAEQQIMKLLAAAPGVAVTRDALIARLVGNVHDFDPHRLEMLVFRLRRKCLREAGVALPLQTVRGVGYVLAW